MNREDAEEYTQSLGQIVGGSYRQIGLAYRLGVPATLGYKKADGLRKWVTERLGGYVQMAITERKIAVAELAADGYSNREIAAVVGVDAKTVRNDRTGENSPDDEENTSQINGDNSKDGENSPLLDFIPAGQKTRTKNENERREILEAEIDSELAPGLYHGDFRDLSKQIADESVDLVFTDPPYDADSIKLYAAAAKVAARILKPGGSFIAYSGQRHLPEVLAACSTYLDYWWTIAGIHGGSKQVLNKLGVRCGWKPLVWFVKGTRGDVQNILFDTITGDREKDEHEWQQSEEEARYYIEKLTTNGGTIVDFFIGGGTTAAAAKRLGRKWIGFEIDSEAMKRASKRISEIE